MVVPGPREVERRRAALQRAAQGEPVTAICAALGRSREWFYVWQRRYRADGPRGLQDRSHAPHQPRRSPRRVEAGVLAAREALVAAHGTRLAFTGIGAEAITWELAHRGWKQIPALRTIDRILQRHGRTGRRPPTRERGTEPYPGPRARHPGDVHQTDLVGPRHLRGPQGPIRFYSFHTVDVVAHTPVASQYRTKGTEALSAHLLAAWRRLGLPRTWQTDNEMVASGRPRVPGSFPQATRLALLLGVHVVFIPPGEPGRQAHVESFNALWQDRVLGRYACPSLARLRRVSARFERYVWEKKPHRHLTVHEHGTRFPGAWLRRHGARLHTVPARFALDAYRDARRRLHLPLAAGRVTFIRRVEADGSIEAGGAHLVVGRRFAHQYVTATYVMHRRCIVVKHHHRVLKRVPWTPREPVVRPLLPLPRGHP
jgi:putative transposase